MPFSHLDIDLENSWIYVSQPLSQFEEEFGLFRKPKAEHVAPAPSCYRISIFVVGVLCMGLGAIVLFHEYLGSVLSWLGHLDGVEGPIFVGLLYIVVAFPFSWGYIVVNVGAGYLYGFQEGLVITVIGATLGAFIAFEICRWVFSDYVSNLLGQYQNFQQIIKILDGKQGFNIIAMTRLTPLPFGLQNAFFSASTVSRRVYLGATLIGSLPMQVVNTYMGTTLRSMEDVLSGGNANMLMLFFQVLITIFISLFINQRMKRELKKVCENETDANLIAAIDSCPPHPPLRHVASVMDLTEIVLEEGPSDNAPMPYYPPLHEVSSEKEAKPGSPGVFEQGPLPPLAPIPKRFASKHTSSLHPPSPFHRRTQSLGSPLQ